MKKIILVWSFMSISLFFFFAVPMLGAGAEDASGKIPHKVPAATSKVKIDGILNEALWHQFCLLW